MDTKEYIKQRRELSTRLVKAREMAGFTQKQVAATEIVTQSELSKLENGTRRVDFIVLLELIKLYKQELEFFRL
ncbi:MAG: helix-turn-helix domain-containing protein [Marinifilaceae bacterium]